jgi:hypothetical protein
MSEATSGSLHPAIPHIAFAQAGYLLRQNS